MKLANGGGTLQEQRKSEEENNREADPHIRVMGKFREFFKTARREGHM